MPERLYDTPMTSPMYSHEAIVHDAAMQGYPWFARVFDAFAETPNRKQTRQEIFRAALALLTYDGSVLPIAAEDIPEPAGAGKHPEHYQADRYHLGTPVSNQEEQKLRIVEFFISRRVAVWPTARYHNLSVYAVSPDAVNGIPRLVSRHFEATPNPQQTMPGAPDAGFIINRAPELRPYEEVLAHRAAESIIARLDIIDA